MDEFLLYDWYVWVCVCLRRMDNIKSHHSHSIRLCLHNVHTCVDNCVIRNGWSSAIISMRFFHFTIFFSSWITLQMETQRHNRDNFFPGAYVCVCSNTENREINRNKNHENKHTNMCKLEFFARICLVLRVELLFFFSAFSESREWKRDPHLNKSIVSVAETMLRVIFKRLEHFSRGQQIHIQHIRTHTDSTTLFCFNRIVRFHWHRYVSHRHGTSQC